jgi:hypothetical protein
MPYHEHLTHRSQRISWCFSSWNHFLVTSSRITQHSSGVCFLWSDDSSPQKWWQLDRRFQTIDNLYEPSLELLNNAVCYLVLDYKSTRSCLRVSSTPDKVRTRQTLIGTVNGFLVFVEKIQWFCLIYQSVQQVRNLFRIFVHNFAFEIVFLMHFYTFSSMLKSCTACYLKKEDKMVLINIGSNFQDVTARKNKDALLSLIRKGYDTS